MKTPHYLRVVRALAFAASVPACSAAPETNAPVDDSPAAAPPSNDRAAPPADELLATHADASTSDASTEATAPHTSGPIMPPELA